MFLAHGWTRIFSLNTNRSNKANVLGSQMDTDLPCGWNNPMVRRKKIRLIRAIRVQKNKWSGGKICEIREIRVL